MKYCIFDISDFEKLLQFAEKCLTLNRLMQKNAPEEPAKILNELDTPSEGIEISCVYQYPGLNANEADPIWKSVQALTNAPGPIKVAFGTEAGFFANIGLRAAVIGPGSMKCDGHQPDEGIDINQLRKCKDFCGKLQHGLQSILSLN